MLTNKKKKQHSRWALFNVITNLDQKVKHICPLGRNRALVKKKCSFSIKNSQLTQVVFLLVKTIGTKALFRLGTRTRALYPRSLNSVLFSACLPSRTCLSPWWQRSNCPFSTCHFFYCCMEEKCGDWQNPVQTSTHAKGPMPEYSLLR